MKELSIEQKAQRYDEAIERAKELLEIGLKDTRDKRVVLSFFPELKESSDEEIKKAIHIYLDWIDDKKDYAPKGKYTIKDMIAWLEKQGDKSVNIDIESMVSSYKQRLKSQGGIENSPLVNMCLSAFRHGVENTLEELNLKKFEKKKLKKIDQKPAWREEDESMLYGVIETEQYMLDVVNGIKKFDVGNASIKEDCTRELNWLKSLKDRVIPQPKQEWKQENTGDLTDFENAMMHIGDSFFGQHAGLDPNDTNVVKEQANLLLELVPKQEWSEEEIENCAREAEDNSCIILAKHIRQLKYLRPQNTWKPSDEQMGVIEAVINNRSFQRRHLDSLYADLKKLREE